MKLQFTVKKINGYWHLYQDDKECGWMHTKARGAKLEALSENIKFYTQQRKLFRFDEGNESLYILTATEGYQFYCKISKREWKKSKKENKYLEMSDLCKNCKHLFYF